MANIGDLEKKINSELTTKIKESEIKHNQLYITINSEDLLDVILLLKTNKNTKFRQLIDITAVDYPENQKRFKIVYLLLSHEFNQRIILSYFISENEKISSLTKIFPSANWMEREIFDMYGITAAHKTIPLNTIARVTNKSNGKSIILRINDRGPYVNGRILDCSYGAAKKLGFMSMGTANVKIEIIELGDGVYMHHNE